MYIIIIIIISEIMHEQGNIRNVIIIEYCTTVTFS